MLDRPSTNVPLELIPCIDTLTSSASTQTREPGTANDGVDAATLLRDNEAVAAFLETTLSDLADPPSYSMGSMSPESDIDTTSTISLAGGEGGRKVGQKRRQAAGQQRVPGGAAGKGGGGGGGGGTQDKARSSHAGPGAPVSRSRAWTSLELTDDDLNSSLLSDTQPPATAAAAATSRGRGGQAQSGGSKAEPGRAGRGRTTSGSPSGVSSSTSAPAAAATTKPSAALRPRPTRASILRRARLGDTPEVDVGDVDRMSVASDASTASTASVSRPAAPRRTLSRIEALAQPRRPRVCSPSARSDSEATSSRTRGLAVRPAPESAPRSGFRSGGHPSTVGAAPRARANSASKLPDKSAVSCYNNNTSAGEILAIFCML